MVQSVVGGGRGEGGGGADGGGVLGNMRGLGLRGRWGRERERGERESFCM